MHVWEQPLLREVSVASSQFCCQPKTALLKSLIITLIRKINNYKVTWQCFHGFNKIKTSKTKNKYYEILSYITQTLFLII